MHLGAPPYWLATPYNVPAMRLTSSAIHEAPAEHGSGLPARSWLVVGTWLAALIVAFFLDAAAARYVRTSGLESHVHGKWFATVVKLPGYFWFTLIIAAALWALHPLRWRAALFVSLCGIVSGLNWLVKWVAGRTRPYKLPDSIPQPAPFYLQPFREGLRGLFFHTSNLDFPSGHACLSFATAAALAYLVPRYRIAFYGGAAVVTAERVAENAHYLSDAVAGAAFGIVGVWVIRHLLPRDFFSSDPSGKL